MKETFLNGFEAAAEGGLPVIGEVRENLLEPFIAATRAALGEMAGAEPVVRAVSRKPMQHALGDIAAVIRLRSIRGDASLVLGFPQRTAAALARRILADATQAVEEDLIRDCVGEIANVVAGQAKALLAERPVRFEFRLPQMVVNGAEFRPPKGLECLVVVFDCDQGEFALQLFVKY
jgi:chemotaxis protein CheX